MAALHYVWFHLNSSQWKYMFIHKYFEDFKEMKWMPPSRKFLIDFFRFGRTLKKRYQKLHVKNFVYMWLVVEFMFNSGLGPPAIRKIISMRFFILAVKVYKKPSLYWPCCSQLSVCTACSSILSYLVFVQCTCYSTA